MEFLPFGVSYPSYPRAYPRQRPAFIDPFSAVHGFGNPHPRPHPLDYRDVPFHVPCLDDNNSGLFPSLYGYPLRKSATPLSRKRRSQKSSPKRKPINTPSAVVLSECGTTGGSFGEESSPAVLPLIQKEKTDNSDNNEVNKENTMDDIVDPPIVPGDEELVEAAVSLNTDDDDIDDAAVCPGDMVSSVNAEEVQKRLEDIKTINTKVESLRSRIDEFSGEQHKCDGDGKEQLYLTETLMSYLLQLDKIHAEGHNGVRLARKQVVLKIGKYIEDIERKAVESSLPTTTTITEQCINDSSNTNTTQPSANMSAVVPHTKSTDDLTYSIEATTTDVDSTDMETR